MRARIMHGRVLRDKDDGPEVVTRCVLCKFTVFCTLYPRGILNSPLLPSIKHNDLARTRRPGKCLD